MGAAGEVRARFVRELKAQGFREHEAQRAAAILVQAVQPARLVALCRLLVDSGDMTPYAARRVRAALGLPADDDRGDDDTEE